MLPAYQFVVIVIASLIQLSKRKGNWPSVMASDFAYTINVQLAVIYKPLAINYCVGQSSVRFA
ncbi:hypothetical protein D3C76_1567640 [compost metagenome]